MSPVSHNFRKPFGSPPAEISDHMQHFKKDISCESDFFSLARADRSGTGTSVCGTQPQTSLSSSGICVQRLEKTY